ncbi:NAD(P)H-binding protein [Bdellovibrio sp. HCB2-146]|uniref:NAD(P)H-binding protein n=1 Tax=Bdellovibrio sp. HCB2-146 TaxID=3394362 RepID=UPI0039BC6C96
MNTLDITLIGASGLVGNHLLMQLTQQRQVNVVKAVTRKKLDFIPPKTENIVINFDHMEEFTNEMKASVFICCLGTTIKKAGSQEAFRKVDFDYVLHFAKIAEKVRAKKLMVVSAMGADAHSKVFYNRVKGEMEEAIQKLNIPQVEIFRPSLILGERSEARPLEGLAQALTPVLNTVIMHGPLKKYRGIEATDIAKAMVTASLSYEIGHQVHESDVIQAMADRSK